MKWTNLILRTIQIVLLLLTLVLIVGSSSVSIADQTERVRAFTRKIEFDYAGWTLDALRVKLDQAVLGTVNYMSERAQHQFVLDYLDLVVQIQQTEAELQMIYGDPDIKDPQSASKDIRLQLDELYKRNEQMAPIAESILQEQLSIVASEMGLTMGGQPIPPVLYHSTPLPWALIISPRDKIVQEENISLIPELTVAEHVVLEEQVDQALNVSSLVVGVGGIGTYPTMVYRTANLPWLSEVVAHEWTHNFLTLRPLGLNYMTSPELRTMNETAASIAGKEIGMALLESFYPELVPPPPPEPPPDASEEPPPQPEPPIFDFRAEMHETRVTVDELLDEGKIEEAEEYMEQRRQYFWENGYHIRKLNQAYFAFYGAYADVPGGAAGEDPVGAAVRQLRADSPSLAVFLKRISWMTSFEQLKRAVEGAES